jgi:hypothetical protein
VPPLDVGAFTDDGKLMSVAQAREFFILTGWSDGDGYQNDLERLSKNGPGRPMDRKRAKARRRLRELIGHGECIMGLTDSYPARYAFITEDLLRSIEEACNRWRWRLHGRAKRLSQVHGDLHPWNVLFRRGSYFTVLDRSRGEW